MEDKTTVENFLALDEMNRLVEKNGKNKEEVAFTANEMGLDPQTSSLLENKIEAFHKWQKELAQNYLKREKNHSKEPLLYYLHGFSEENVPEPLILTEEGKKSSGGIFLRLKGKGIVINPGPKFLTRFFQNGLHIRDIDFVIVTHEREEAFAEVPQIYELASQLNSLSQERQAIRYYLHHEAYQVVSSLLKPQSKKEKEALYPLELFRDSPDIERASLAEGLNLHYFPLTTPSSEGSFGIRLEYNDETNSSEKVNLGYITEGSWNPALAHHLGPCEILVVGLGRIDFRDLQKVSYRAKNLGYNGVFTLLEEVNPKLLLCGEFSGLDGDIRLEILQKLRQEHKARKTSILVADNNLIVHLKNFTVKSEEHCRVHSWVEASQVKTMGSIKPFGPLDYLSPNSCL